MPRFPSFLVSPFFKFIAVHNLLIFNLLQVRVTFQIDCQWGWDFRENIGLLVTDVGIESLSACLLSIFDSMSRLKNY